MLAQEMHPLGSRPEIRSTLNHLLAMTTNGPRRERAEAGTRKVLGMAS